jgi:hypothetical protein
LNIEQPSRLPLLEVRAIAAPDLIFWELGTFLATAGTVYRSGKAYEIKRQQCRWGY